MKLPHGINPAHCASSDQTRFVLNGVKIEDGIAVATDGRVFMASTVELSEEDTNRPALIPTRAMMKAFPKSRGKRSRRSVIDTLRIDPIPEADPVATFGTVTITDKDLDLTTVKEIDGNFPKWHQVLEDPKPMTKRLTINVALLARIAKSFGDDGLTLHLDPDGFQAPGYKPPIYVTSKSGEAFAILMPMRSDSDPIAIHPLLMKCLDAKVEAEIAKRAAAEAAAKAAAETTTQPQTETTTNQ